MAALKKILPYISLALLLWGIGLALFISNINKPHPEPTSTMDAILVLTGGTNRITTALDLFSSGLSNQIFITGVHPDTKLQDIKSKQSGNLKLPNCCITLGHEARTTKQNAQEVKKWLTGKQYKTFLLVTSHYHMPRARIEFENTGILKSQITPYAVKQEGFSFFKKTHALLILSEYHKTIFRWVQIKLGLA